MLISNITEANVRITRKSHGVYFAHAQQIQYRTEEQMEHFHYNEHNCLWIHAMFRINPLKDVTRKHVLTALYIFVREG